MTPKVENNWKIYDIFLYNFFFSELPKEYKYFESEIVYEEEDDFFSPEKQDPGFDITKIDLPYLNE